jgi:hypothetical protein
MLSEFMDEDAIPYLETQIGLRYALMDAVEKGAIIV